MQQRMERNVHVIGACSGWGAQIRACEAGPEALVQAHVFERLKKQGAAIDAVELLYPEKKAKDQNIPLAESLPLIRDFNMQLYHALKKTLQKKSFPIVVGGDHSIAVGTWNSFPKPFGLIWIDAHLDAHTPQTSPSGAYHGMPAAALLGHGLPEMAQFVSKEPVLKPENFAYIGVRSYEAGEVELIERLGVKVFYMDEVKKRGLAAIIPEAISHVTRHCSHYGVSLDLDGFDPNEAPGVGSPEPEGIQTKALLPLLEQFGKDPKLIGFELVEYNPERDVSHKTAELVYEILRQVMKI